MLNKMLKFLIPALSWVAVAQASVSIGPVHTENNELVCQMNDFFETKLFVDLDADWDEPNGQLSSKVLEMPTKNAYANNNKLFQVEVVKVKRKEFKQTIIYKPEGIRDVISKLEVTEGHAKITYGVNKNGRPTYPSFVFEGPCTANEVE